jgi:hypothetical protein
MKKVINHYKVTSLPASPKPDSVYFVKTVSGTHLYVTDATGVPYAVIEDGLVITADWAKSLIIENPGSNENISIFYTDVSITINKMVGVLVGSGGPSVTWSVKHSPDRSSVGNEVVTGGTTTTNVTTGDVITTFNDATIPANSFVWFTTTAKSGTIIEFNISLIYTKD